MTVKILGAWNGRSPGQIVTLDGATETRLINAGLATSDLNYQASESGDMVRALRNTLTGGSVIVGPNSTLELAAGANTLSAVASDPLSADVAALLADVTSYPEGATLSTRGGRFDYVVAAPSAAVYDATTAGGVKLIAQPDSAGFFFAEQFGLIGDGSDESAGLRAAHAAAVSRGTRLVFGKSKTYGLLSTALNPAISITASIEIDLNGSTIKLLNDGNGAGGTVISIYAISKGGADAPHVKIRNGTLRAPLNYDELAAPFPLFDAMTDSGSGLSWNSAIKTAVGNVNLTVDGVSMLGYWGTGVLGSTGSTGGVKTRIVNSRIDALVAPFSAAAFGTPNIDIEIVSSTLNGHSNQGVDWSGRGRVVYPQPHINLFIDDCILTGAGRAQINHYSSSMNMSDVEAGTTQKPDKIIRVLRTHFKATPGVSNAAMLTNNLGQWTYLYDCTFDGVAGVNTRSPTRIKGCSAINGGALFQPYTSNPRYPEFDITLIEGGCADKPAAPVSTITTGWMDPVSAGRPNRVSVSGVVFNGGNVWHTGSFKLVINSCEFSKVDPLSSKLTGGSSEIVFNSCSFSGQSDGLITSTGTPKVQINNSSFDMNAWGNITLAANPSSGESVTINDGSGAQTLTFGSGVTIGATKEASARNLVDSINQLGGGIAAYDRGDGSLYLVQESVANISALVAVTKSAAAITVTGMVASNPLGFAFNATNLTGSGNTFVNGTEPRAAGSGANLGLPAKSASGQRASTGTLYLSPNGDFTEITGTAAVAHIRFDRAYDVHKLFNGSVITLYSVNGFQLVDTGNIALLGASPTTVSAGNNVRLRWMGVADKWVEQA